MLKAQQDFSSTKVTRPQNLWGVMMENLTDDETRLIRLFRCLDSDSRECLLREAALRILKVTPIDDYHFFANPKREELEELTEPIVERLYRVIPYDSYLMDLHDYDYHFAEIAWEDDVESILLGISEFDGNAAEMLVEAYLEGVYEYGMCLATEFGTTEDQMMADLRKEALKLIHSWRERILKRIEKQYESK